jgi:uncharacterized protein with von Willebrand factor type A (vWA) domain
VEAPLLHNVVLFGRVLRGAGIETGPGRMTEAVRALRLVGFSRREDVRALVRCLFARRREDLPVVDSAFDLFWRRHAVTKTSHDLRAMGERRLFPKPGRAPAAGPPARDEPEGAPSAQGPPRLSVVRTWSADEVLRAKDFATLSADEEHAVRDLIQGLRWRVRERLSRRRRPGQRGAVDLRRTLRQSLRLGLEVVRLERRERKTRPRPLVVLADVSGSMERYTRPLLLFVHALAATPGTEAFTFGTRLTRITPALRRGGLSRVLREVSRAVPDWSGGTRIGATLAEFNRRWAGRVLGHGAVVLVVSDGWDRGDVDVLGAEMARLQRRAFRLVWLNPLLGSPDYQPLARGMQAALPYVDDFLSVRDFASLEALAGHLNALDPRRRRPAARPSSARPLRRA